MFIDDYKTIVEKASALGFIPTSEEKLRGLIIAGLERKGGYCPCKLQKIEDNKCPCIELREQGTCTCKLFVRKG
jgi:ferredoxin-thioredoxin reductase catalytic subunit